jgi:hypothetical protein
MQLKRSSVYLLDRYTKKETLDEYRKEERILK